MNKKGFTLTEILAVIVLMAVISLIAYSATNVVQKSINDRMYKSTLNLIKDGAKNYGEDRQAKLDANGVEVSVWDLIKNNYIPLKKVTYNDKMNLDTASKNRYCNNNECLLVVDNRKNMGDDNYILNEKKVKVKYENNRVYVDLLGLDSD